MTPELMVLIVGVPIGLITAATSGVASLGVRRLLKSHDEMKTSHAEMRKEQAAQGQLIAVMQTKLPNGEWRAVTEGLAACTAGVNAVSMDVAALRGELGQHVLAGAEMHAVVATCKGLLESNIMCPQKPKRVKRARH